MLKYYRAPKIHHSIEFMIIVFVYYNITTIISGTSVKSDDANRFRGDSQHFDNFKYTDSQVAMKICVSNSSAVYFGPLVIIDTIYLVLHVIYELQNALGINTYLTPVIFKLFNFLFITLTYT
ncbi:hypothetical protein MAR_024729, partial [Mya arenaria]